jgi:hypothetical protein
MIQGYTAKKDTSIGNEYKKYEINLHGRNQSMQAVHSYIK